MRQGFTLAALRSAHEAARPKRVQQFYNDCRRAVWERVEWVQVVRVQCPPEPSVVQEVARKLRDLGLVVSARVVPSVLVDPGIGRRRGAGPSAEKEV